MDAILTKFNLSAPNMTTEWLVCVGICWLIVVICGLFSIWGQSRRVWVKVFWSLLVVCVPLLGLLTYLPFSVEEELYPYLGFWRKPKS